MRDMLAGLWMSVSGIFGVGLVCLAVVYFYPVDNGIIRGECATSDGTCVVFLDAPTDLDRVVNAQARRTSDGVVRFSLLYLKKGEGRPLSIGVPIYGRIASVLTVDGQRRDVKLVRRIELRRRGKLVGEPILVP